MVDVRHVKSFLTKPTRIRLVFLLLLTAMLSVFPLVYDLGYFSALVLAPILSWICVSAGLEVARLHRQAQSGRGAFLDDRATLRIAWTIGGPALLAHLFLPGIVLWISGLIHESCDPWGGLVFYVMGPVFAGVLGWSCGFAAGILTEKRGMQRILGYAPWLVCTGIGLWRLYTHPVVFAMDPFWGWFSGPIYDESVAVDARYGLYRLYNFVWLIALWSGLDVLRDSISGSRNRSARRRSQVIFLISFILGSIFTYHGDDLRFDATRASLRQELSLVRETPHFRIYYAPNSATARQIDVLAAEHEFAWSELEQKLASHPPYPIESFVFPSANVKRRLFGAGRVEVSLPWRQQIYLNHEDFPQHVLHHELAHAFGRSFGDPIFGLSRRGLTLNGGLIEGLATAVAPRSYAELDLHDQAAILEKLEKRPALADLMGVGFWSQASSRAYTAAGSFCLWILEEFGPDTLRKIYTSAGDFEAATGKSLSELETQWVAMLRARELEEDDIAYQALRFQRRSIFARPCAHRVGSAIDAAKEAVDRGESKSALLILREICELEPENVSHRLRLVHHLVEQGELQLAAESIESALALSELLPPERAALLETQGDLAWQRGQHDDAIRFYIESLALPVRDSKARALTAKLYALQQTPPARDALWNYFRTRDLHDSAATQLARHIESAAVVSEFRSTRALGSYLRGLQLIQQDLPDLALPHFQAAVEPPQGSDNLPSEPLIRAAQERYLNVLLQTRHWDLARELIAKMQHRWSTRSGHALEDAIAKRRIAFFEQYFQEVAAHPQTQNDPHITRAGLSSDAFPDGEEP